MSGKKKFPWMYVDPFRFGKKHGKTENGNVKTKSCNNVQAETCPSVSTKDIAPPLHASGSKTLEAMDTNYGTLYDNKVDRKARTKIAEPMDKNVKVRYDNRDHLSGIDWQKSIDERTRIYNAKQRSLSENSAKTGIKNACEDIKMGESPNMYNRSRSVGANPVQYNQGTLSVDQRTVQSEKQGSSGLNNRSSYSNQDFATIHSSNHRNLFENRERQSIQQRSFRDSRTHQQYSVNNDKVFEKPPKESTVHNIRFDSSDYDTIDSPTGQGYDMDNPAGTLVITNESLVRKYEQIGNNSNPNSKVNNPAVKSYSCQNLLPSFNTERSDRMQNTHTNKMVSSVDSSSEDIDDQSSSEYVEYFIRCNGTVIKQKNTSSSKISASDSRLNNDQSNKPITPASFEYKNNNGYGNHNGSITNVYGDSVSLTNNQNRSLKSRKLKSLFKSRSKERKLEKHISWGTVNEHFDEYPYPPKVRQLEQKTFTESANNTLRPKKSMSLNLTPGFHNDQAAFDTHYNLESPSSIGSASSLIDSQADIYGSSESSTLSNHSAGVDHQDISGCHVSSSLSHLPPSGRSNRDSNFQQRDTKSELDLAEIMSTFSDLLDVPSLDYPKSSGPVSNTSRNSALKNTASFGCQKDLQGYNVSSKPDYYKAKSIDLNCLNPDKHYGRSGNVSIGGNRDLFSQEFECNLTEFQSELMRSDSTDTLTEDSFAELEQQSSELQKSISLLEDLDTFSSSKKQNIDVTNQFSTKEVSSPNQNKSQSCYDLVFGGKENNKMEHNRNKQQTQNVDQSFQRKGADLFQRQQMKHAISHDVVHNAPQPTNEPLNSWLSLQEVLKELDPNFESCPNIDVTDNAIMSPKSNEGQSEIKSQMFVSDKTSPKVEYDRSYATTFKSDNLEISKKNAEVGDSDQSGSTTKNNVPRDNEISEHHQIGQNVFKKDNFTDNSEGIMKRSIYGQPVQNRVTSMTMLNGKIMGHANGTSNKQNGSCTSLPVQTMTEYCSNQLKVNPQFGSDFQLKKEDHKTNFNNYMFQEREISYSDRSSSELSGSDIDMFNSSSSMECSSVASSSFSEISHKEQFEFDMLLKSLGCDDKIDLNSNNSNNNGKSNTLPILKPGEVNHNVIKNDLLYKTESLGTKQVLELSTNTHSSSQVSGPGVMQCSINNERAPPSWKLNNDFNSVILHNKTGKVEHVRNENSKNNVSSIVSVRKTVTVINSETIEKVEVKNDSADLDSKGNKLKVKKESVISSHKHSGLNDNSYIDGVNTDSCHEITQSAVEITSNGNDDAVKFNRSSTQDSDCKVNLNSDKTTVNVQVCDNHNRKVIENNSSVKCPQEDNRVLKVPSQRSDGDSDIHNLLELNQFQLIELQKSEKPDTQSDIICDNTNATYGQIVKGNSFNTITSADSCYIKALSNKPNNTGRSQDGVNFNSSHREKISEGPKSKSLPFTVRAKTLNYISKEANRTKMASLENTDSSTDMVYDNVKNTSQTFAGVRPKYVDNNGGNMLSSTPYRSRKISDKSYYGAQNTSKLDSILEGLNEFVNEPSRFEQQQRKYKYESSNIPRTWSTQSVCLEMNHNRSKIGMEYPLIRSTSFGDGVYEAAEGSRSVSDYPHRSVPRSSTVIGLKSECVDDVDNNPDEGGIYEGISQYQSHFYSTKNQAANQRSNIDFSRKGADKVKPLAIEDLIATLYDIDHKDNQSENLSMDTQLSHSSGTFPSVKYSDAYGRNITSTESDYHYDNRSAKKYPLGERNLSHRTEICGSKNVPINPGRPGDVNYGDNARFISSGPSTPYEDPLLLSNSKMVTNNHDVTKTNKTFGRNEVVYEEIGYSDTRDYVELQDGQHVPKRPSNFKDLKDSINVSSLLKSNSVVSIQSEQKVLCEYTRRESNGFSNSVRMECSERTWAYLQKQKKLDENHKSKNLINCDRNKVVTFKCQDSNNEKSAVSNSQNQNCSASQKSVSVRNMVVINNKKNINQCDNNMFDKLQQCKFRKRKWSPKGLCCIETYRVVDSHHHTFIEKSFKKPRNCDLCDQLIWNTAQVCRVCKYVCHRKCETQVCES